jgi:CHAD domain-containing protein
MIPQRLPPPQKWIRPALQSRSSAAAAFVSNVQAAIAQIHANAHGASLGRNPEYLHQLRVGIRRLRSTLRAFRALVRRQRARRFDREWRTVLRSTSAARDWDAFLHSRVSPALRKAGLRQRALAQTSLRVSVAPRKLARLTGRVHVWSQSKPWRASARPGEALGPFGGRALQVLHEAVRDSAEGIDWSDARRRHRVRIRVKRLRYGCDCFAAGFPTQAMEAFQHRLKKLQELLGDLNDIVVQRRLLKELACTKGTTINQLAARERLLLKGLEKIWSKFEAHPPPWRREAARARG